MYVLTLDDGGAGVLWPRRRRPGALWRGREGGRGGALTSARRWPRGRWGRGGGAGEARRRHGGATTTYGSGMTRRRRPTSGWRGSGGGARPGESLRRRRRRQRWLGQDVEAARGATAVKTARATPIWRMKTTVCLNTHWRMKTTVCLNTHGDL